VGIFVQGGRASIEGEFTVDLVDAGASDSDDRLILAGFNDSGLTSDLGDLFDFLDTDLSGEIAVVLPLLYGLESTVSIVWGLHFGFGIDLHKGFYFVSKYDDPDVAGDDNPEMTFDLALDLDSDDGSPRSSRRASRS
jgi:hypothetical protein